ncbi:hypothetical protein [Nocardioides ungokensis]|uniref:hypothetical protein n=1 Tax=Nocardioides ungokensis TaxID=1643322 RepID=UPI0015DD6E26|nr:hypothetical protein [Nocardioides ungokensis]
MVSTTAPATGSSTPMRDDRSFYRIALAVVAPLPMTAMGLNYILLDMPGDSSFHDIVASAARQETVVQLSLWLSVAWFAFLIPAVIGVAAVSRQARPRLAAWGIVLTVPGFALGFSGPNDTALALLTHTKQLDVRQISNLDEALWALPQFAVSSLLFIVGIVIGLLLLGIALARSGAVPPLYGIALAIGGFTHPFLGALGHTVQGIGLLVAGLGFAGASIALWRMPNDAFLPARPTKQARPAQLPG